MAERSFSDYVAAANATLVDPARNRQVGAGEARFELYHSGPSISAQQVRLTLAETGAAWISHDMIVHPPAMENYHPDMVRLRMQGAGGREMVGGYTGRTATRSEGFDPTVVPTLVDRTEARVHVDAVAICEHIARVGEGAADLLPARLRREAEREIAIADGLPLQALVLGAHPDGDFRAPEVRGAMAGVHDYRIMKLMEARSLSVGHPRLIAAYDAKIRKEAAARQYVRTPDLMRGAAAEVLKAVADLDGRLSDGRGWVAGDAFTLADVFWAVTLWRLKWLGMGFAWDGGHALNGTEYARVAAYAARLFERPAFRAAVIDWPTASRTGFVAGHYRSAAPQAPGATAPRMQPVDGHGRDIREESLTSAVLATMKGTGNPRARTVLNAFTRHLHAFLEEVRPTEAEWEWGIEFLTRTGHLCKDGRQEFILLSDVMGATARVDLINNRAASGATENSVLGPFYVDPRPAFENGADISGGIRGKPMFFNARVLDTEGKPIAGANVDIWHADGDGGYDVIMEGVDVAMRGLFRSDGQGRVWFLSILPESYPIPDDGTVGQLLHGARRNIMRPAHVHVRIEAPGYRRLTTMLFLEGDPYLDADPVFGVKQSLVMPFVERTGVRAPDGRAVPSPAWCVDYEFVLTRDRGR